MLLINSHNSKKLQVANNDEAFMLMSVRNAQEIFSMNTHTHTFRTHLQGNRNTLEIF